MTTEPIRSREEAREQLKRLEDFFGAPVQPLWAFCSGISTWMDCIIKNNTDPELTQGSMRHGYKYYEALNQMRIDIRKSNLLGRLLYAKEQLRTLISTMRTFPEVRLPERKVGCARVMRTRN